MRKLTASCASEQNFISVAMYAHTDSKTTGLVDIVLQMDLGKLLGKASFLVNDVKAERVQNDPTKTQYLFTDGDITVDLLMDDEKHTAGILTESNGKRIEMKCETLD